MTTSREPSKKRTASKKSAAKPAVKRAPRAKKSPAEPEIPADTPVFPDLRDLNAATDPNWYPRTNALEKVLTGCSEDPHAALGMHYLEGAGIYVRVINPQADGIIFHWNGHSAPMCRVNTSGLWSIGFMGHKKHFKYELEFLYGEIKVVREDPYCFLPQVSEDDLYLFNEGTLERAYDCLGAHAHTCGDVEGELFCVWAPSADRVSVVGDFNSWDGRRHPMRRLGSSGVWELFIPRLGQNELYKYEIRAKNGDIFLKLDPYARRTEKRPNNAGITDESIYTYQWHDQQWLEQRKKTNALERPMSIYEVHLSSWQGPGLRRINNQDENDHHNYRELAEALCRYLKKMNYTHIELMPILEHPLDASWGYQVSAYYAPSARYGTPEDFAYFVDYMHSNGIGVLLDWVPAHFPKDAFSLGRFDGTALYEHADPRQGEHQDWGTYIFNFGRCEVVSFLISNALYWLDKFHIDGLRVDAVASMLYLDYSREAGQWVPNCYGGNENLEAIAFLRRLNTLSNELFPGTLMIAEESTAFPGVSHPIYDGGLGFNFKWNMGWMHDVLSYFSTDPYFRNFHQNELTLPLQYFPTENFILPLSHDEVVHGKCSLLNKMPGDAWRKFANLRALYTWMIVHPGKKLIFMGGEFAQWIEWNFQQGLDWLLLDYETHRQIQRMCAALNKLYVQTPSLWEVDFDEKGFEWIDASNYQQSVVIFARWDKAHRVPVVLAANLTPEPHDNYQIGVPLCTQWREVFNSDAALWGGSGICNPGMLQAEKVDEPFHGQHQRITLHLPPLGACILMPEAWAHEIEQ